MSRKTFHSTYSKHSSLMKTRVQHASFQEIKIESFWGCVASFLLFQLFGYVIYQSFLHHLDPTTMLPLPIGFIWILVFMLGEAGTMYHIRKFFMQQGSHNAIHSLHTTDDVVKMLLSILFAIFLVLIYLGYYPLPKKDIDIIGLMFFYGISWIVSYIASFSIDKFGSKLKQNKAPGAIIGGILVGSIFIVFSLIFNPVLFYLFGLMGLGVIVLLSSSLLLEDQIKR